METVNIEELVQDQHNFNKGTEEGARLMEKSFTELLLAQGASVERKGVVEKAYVARKENQGGTQGGGTNPQNPNDNGELG